MQYKTLLGTTGATGQLPWASAEVPATWSGNTEAYSGFPQTAWNAAGTSQGSAVTATTVTYGTGTTMGTWVRPNLIRRAVHWNLNTTALLNTANTKKLGIQYNVTENNATITRQGTGNFWGIRSYNRDARLDDFPSSWLTFPGRQSSLDLGGDYRASKNYIAVEATITNGGKPYSAIGYEGIFKTVVAMLNGYSASEVYKDKEFVADGNDNQPVHIVGSNILGPTSSIAGFPLMMENMDLRYVKLMPASKATSGTNNQGQFYWITTEIICPWFASFVYTQNGADITSRSWQLFGDAGSYMTAGYGDLTFTYHQDFKE